MTSSERQLEEELIEKLEGLKYEVRTDIRDRASLERNFREKFEALNCVSLTNVEFQRLLDQIVTPDVFTAAHTRRNRNAFTRDDGTPLNGVPAVQIGGKTFGIIPAWRWSRLVEYKNNSGNGYTPTRLN